MRYEKPIVIDLSQNARAQGRPRACVPGDAVIPLGLCGPGSADASCYAGTGGDQTVDDCRSGTSPDHSCLLGTMAGWECAGGPLAELAGTCTTGPTIVT
jgi:hypothetical protein